MNLVPPPPPEKAQRRAQLLGRPRVMRAGAALVLRTGRTAHVLRAGAALLLRAGARGRKTICALQEGALEQDQYGNGGRGKALT